MKKLPTNTLVSEKEKTPFTVLIQTIEILAYKVRKLRRLRKVEPQLVSSGSRDNEAELENEGDVEYEDDEEEDDEMARQKQIYETAFDCKVSRSDDDVDDLDRISNNPLLISQIRNSASAPFSRASSSTESSKQSQQGSKEQRRKLLLLRPKSLIGVRSKPFSEPVAEATASEDISQSLGALQVTSSPTLSPGKIVARAQIVLNATSTTGSIQEIKGRPKSCVIEAEELILEFKDRPAVSKRCQKSRPRSLVRDNQRIMEFKGRPRIATRRPGYSSTESMATSSSGGSMESLRSSTSEGNRSTSSSESRRSSSLSSHSSDGGISGARLRRERRIPQPSLSSFLAQHAPKLHILSPISDKSSQEPASETSDNNRNNNSQQPSPDEMQDQLNHLEAPLPPDSDKRRRMLPNKNLLNLALQSSSSGDAEIQGSDSGISIESRAGIRCNATQLDNINQLLDNEQDLKDLPFDMPKLRRRRLLMQQQDATTSGSTTSVDLKDLPFDMPKLRRRLRCSQSTESSASQASSSLSVRDAEPPSLFGGSLARPKMTLNLDAENEPANGLAACDGHIITKKPNGLSLGLSLELTASRESADLVDVDLPLERQGWYHGSITRIEAEAVLRLLREGSYLVRNSESTKQDYSLSLKSARGFMHMRIQKNEEMNAYILGQFSKPFESIPEMVRHFSINRLPIRGAEHMCLLHPVIAQLL